MRIDSKAEVLFEQEMGRFEEAKEMYDQELFEISKKEEHRRT